MSYTDELKKFIEWDHNKTLFPLKSVLVFSSFALDHILKYLDDEIFVESWLKKQLEENKYYEVAKLLPTQVKDAIERNAQSFFLIQPWVYAAKDKNHMRQTFQLDPISQIFIYDFVLRNKKYFINNGNDERQNFGYCFDESGKFVQPSEEFESFNKRKNELKNKYKYLGYVDISNCFNNIYHHDVVSYIARLINQEESEKIGKFLREINEGRSTSCMPQGLFPMKIIGSFFLSFIENSRELKSENIVRFMDDIYLFSDDISIINDDILTIQKLIGEKGLCLNEEKTRVVLNDDEEDRKAIEKIKISLLQKRRYRINWYGELEEGEFDAELTDEESTYLKEKLHEKNLEDEDIELILSLLTTNEEEAIELISLVLDHAPHLSKNLYHNLKRNFMSLNDQILDFIETYLDNKSIQEFQLFWITKIIVDFTVLNEPIVDLLIKIYKHPSCTNVVKSVILEIDENNYGLLELKKKIARGHAPELVISSMVGLLSHETSNRNQIYKYLGKSSSMMRVLTLSLSKMERNSLSLINDGSFERFTYSKKKRTSPQSNDPFASDEISFEVEDDDLPF